MLGSRWIQVLFLVLLPALVASGSCSSRTPEGQRVAHGRELQWIWDMYHGGKRNAGRVPKSLDDFNQYQMLHPEAYQAVKSGQVVVIYGLDLAHLESPEQRILAYEKKAPQQGGSVLMADGSIKTMSAEQVQGALKGKG